MPIFYRFAFESCRVEDLPHIFDTMYAARFPDCRRAAAFRDAARGHPSVSSPWFTGKRLTKGACVIRSTVEILCQESSSKNNPARYGHFVLSE